MPTKRTKKSSLPLVPLAAGLGALGVGQTASAAIVYFNPGTVTAFPSGTIYVDIVGGVSSNTTIPGYNFTLSDVNGKPAKPKINGVSLSNVSGYSSGVYYASRFGSGDLISSSSNQPTKTSGYLARFVAPFPPYFPGFGPGGPWYPPSDGVGYIGFSIQPGPTTLYGWMKVGYNGSNGILTLADWAYDDSGAGIQVGSIVPEPAETAVLAALLAGSASLLARRKRQAA